MAVPSSSLHEKMCEESQTEVDYSKMTLQQLREIIKERGLKVKNLSKFKKKKLVAIIEKS